jgi:hypothetical protein
LAQPFDDLLALWRCRTAAQFGQIAFSEKEARMLAGRGGYEVLDVGEPRPVVLDRGVLERSRAQIQKDKATVGARIISFDGKKITLGR